MWNLTPVDGDYKAKKSWWKYHTSLYRAQEQTAKSCYTVIMHTQDSQISTMMQNDIAVTMRLFFS